MGSLIKKFVNGEGIVNLGTGTTPERTVVKLLIIRRGLQPSKRMKFKQEVYYRPP